MAQHNPLSVHADPLASKKEAWSGRFSEPMAEFVLRYTASVNFDKRMAEADIAGSVAHAKMLAKCGIISKEDLNDIERGMRQILQEIKENRFEWKLELEDVHLNIEARLTELVGDAGKRLHTGRSRNDQVALDIRLYLRNEIDQIMDLLSHLQKSLLTVAEKNIDTIMPATPTCRLLSPSLSAITAWLMPKCSSATANAWLTAANASIVLRSVPLLLPAPPIRLTANTRQNCSDLKV